MLRMMNSTTRCEVMEANKPRCETLMQGTERHQIAQSQTSSTRPRALHMETTRISKRFPSRRLFPHVFFPSKSGGYRFFSFPARRHPQITTLGRFPVSTLHFYQSFFFFFILHVSHFCLLKPAFGTRLAFKAGAVRACVRVRV